VRDAYDVVLLYAPPWDGPTRFSKHHLARWFAEHGHRVLYVEAPLTPLGLRRGRSFWREFRQTFQPPRRVADHLWVRRHLLSVPYHAASRLTETRMANRLGQRLLAPVIRRDLRRLGFQRPVVIAGLPHAVDALPRLARGCLVYHCSDDFSAVRGFPRTLPALEAELCSRADLVIATSVTLAEERRLYNPNTHWVSNGADVAHFGRPAEPAAELRALKRPLVGFVGGLSQWVDLEVVAFLARERPRWTFVLIGPLGIPTDAVTELANVRLFGPRPYEVLPSYLAGMDVGLIPFRDEPVTYHADPIKAYEYLAAGLPVVSTDLPALRRLAHVARLARTPRQFLVELDSAIGEGRDAHAAERRAEAAKHSWDARFADVARLIEQTCAS
jgi:glycosyltransferase involved in cell wall biosynthesis